MWQEVFVWLCESVCIVCGCTVVKCDSVNVFVCVRVCGCVSLYVGVYACNMCVCVGM